MTEPRNRGFVVADSVQVLEGSIGLPANARVGRPTGVGERGMLAQGLPRNLGGLFTSCANKGAMAASSPTARPMATKGVVPIGANEIAHAGN